MTLSDISASTKSWLMSLEEILLRCDISVRVLVRSTKESLPSSAESKSMDRKYCSVDDPSLVGVLGADSIEGVCGARRERAG
jgi:hypothetical protein